MVNSIHLEFCAQNVQELTTNVEGLFFLFWISVLKPLVVDWLVIIKKEYYGVNCVGIRIDKERTHTLLIDSQ